MDNEGKQERSRTRWTVSLDKTFADLVVRQIQLGNRPNNVFDKKTWNIIRDEFNRQTDLNFNNNQLRKHLDVLRTRFYNLKSAYDQTNDFTLDDACCVKFSNLWEDLGVQPRPETGKVKDCPIYDQLCTIFADSAADGKYAQSSHYEGLDKFAPQKSVCTNDPGTDNGGLSSCPDNEAPHSRNPQSSKPVQGNTLSAEKVSKVIAERKRKRPSEMQSSEGQSKRDQEICDTMADALLEMVAASKLRRVATMTSDDKFSVTSCIRALDEIQGVDQQLYFAALDLFEDPNLRETFICLKGNQIRVTWLQGFYYDAVSELLELSSSPCMFANCKQQIDARQYRVTEPKTDKFGIHNRGHNARPGHGITDATLTDLLNFLRSQLRIAFSSSVSSTNGQEVHCRKVDQSEFI